MYNDFVILVLRPTRRVKDKNGAEALKAIAASRPSSSPAVTSREPTWPRWTSGQRPVSSTAGPWLRHLRKGNPWERAATRYADERALTSSWTGQPSGTQEGDQARHPCREGRGPAHNILPHPREPEEFPREPTPTDDRS